MRKVPSCEKIITCPTCNGSGVVIFNGKKVDCIGCGGSGTREI